MKLHLEVLGAVQSRVLQTLADRLANHQESVPSMGGRPGRLIASLPAFRQVLYNDALVFP
jgi:hypothetical protein